MEGDAYLPGVAADSANPLLRAVFLRRLRLTRLLLEGGAYINESDGQGHTPLMVACRTRHADSQSASRVKLVQFLLEKGADPDIQDTEGRSALMHACRERAGPEVVSLLLDNGADVSLQDRSGSSALVYAVMAGDWTVLKLLLDACKAKGKEVIIITTDTIPDQTKAHMQPKQYLSIPPADPADHRPLPTAPTSPSDIQLLTSPSSSTPLPVFTFKDQQICRVNSHPCSLSRFRGPGQTAPNGPPQHLLRLNSEPWLKIPASLLLGQPPHAGLRRAEDLSVPKPDQNFNSERLKRSKDQEQTDRSEDQKITLPGLLSSHSASHPNLNSEILAAYSSSSILGGKKGDGAPPASSGLYSVVQKRQLGADIYRSDPQLAVNVPKPPEEQRPRDTPTGKKLAPLRCCSTLGSGEALSPQSKRVLFGHERRGSGTFLLDQNLQARPHSLPPLTNTPILNVHSSGSGLCESIQRGFLPSAPPGHPKDLSRRTLLRRHSMQTEQFKGSA